MVSKYLAKLSANNQLPHQILDFSLQCATMSSQTNAPLPEGIELNGYRIVRKIASGGFSIVYLAEDEYGDNYAIKEYLPATLVKRAVGELIPTIPEKNEATFRNGLKCFFEEGRSLAKIQHPNVIRVNNFFRANETVYMVMGYEEGSTLQELILKHRSRASKANQAAGVENGAASRFGGVISERHIRRIFNQVMNGLREVHTNRLLHLDIKPANIYLRYDGSPILLDFGAARQTLTQEGPKLFPMYTPGFAPPELYRRNQSLGPWTDVYGIGASMFACMIGQPTQPADQRELSDKMPKILDGLRSKYSEPLVQLVDWCLKLNPLDRPQSVFALQRALRKALPSQEPEIEPPSNLSRWIDTVANKISRKRSKSEELTLGG
jgi:eukaryotic-like serine/threonine-protein kinase